MNKFKMNNNRQPGNSPGKFAVDEENSLNVANLSGNQLSNDAGFTAGGPNAPTASFARNANVTTPTQTTETGFGQARQSNPDGDNSGENNPAGREGRTTTNTNRGSLSETQKMARAGKLKKLKDRYNFKNQKLEKIENKFALDKGNVKGHSNALASNAKTNRLA